MAIRTNPEWAKHAVAEALANTITERYNLFKKIMDERLPYLDQKLTQPFTS